MKFNTDPEWLKRKAAEEDEHVVSVGAPPPGPGRAAETCKCGHPFDHAPVMRNGKCQHCQLCQGSEEERLAREIAQSIGTRVEVFDAAGKFAYGVYLDQNSAAHADRFTAAVNACARSYASARLKVELEGLARKLCLFCSRGEPVELVASHKLFWMHPGDIICRIPQVWDRLAAIEKEQI